MNNLVMYKKGEQSWIRYFKKKLRNQLNEMMVITGETGVGKTYFGLAIADKLDSEFDAKEQIAFSFLDMMRIINNFNDPKHSLSKKKYKVCLFDEPQVEIDAKTFNSRVNRSFNYIASTFRHRHICLIFCTPYSDFIDSSTRKLIHTEVSCLGWNKKKKTSRARPLILQYNSKQKKTYYHSLRVIRNGVVNKLVYWTIGLPPKNVRDAYEVMKINFTEKLNQKITRELERDEKEFGEDGHNRKPLTEIQKQTMIVIAKYEGNMKKAIKEIGKSSRTVYFHRGRAETKGYVWSEFTEGGLYG